MNIIQRLIGTWENMSVAQRWSAIHGLKQGLAMVYMSLGWLVTNGYNLPHWILAIWGVVGLIASITIKYRSLINQAEAQVAGGPDTTSSN